MSDEGIELMKRLERERSEELRAHHEALHARRRHALERPEARVEWERAQAAADARDAASGGSFSEWLYAIALAALHDREEGGPLPERSDVQAMRDWFLERVEPDDLGRYRELMLLPDAVLNDLAEHLRLYQREREGDDA